MWTISTLKDFRIDSCMRVGGVVYKFTLGMKHPVDSVLISTFVLFSQGKYVPTISKKIHDENQSADFKINFKGLGIGNGAIDPPNSFEFGEYLYQVNDKIKDN